MTTAARIPAVEAPSTHLPEQESFEGFLVRNFRRAPVLAGVVIGFFLLRGLGVRAGAVLLLAAAAAAVPFSVLIPEVGLWALILNFVNQFDSYYRLQTYLPVSIPIAFDVAIAAGILLQLAPRGRIPRLDYAQNGLLAAYVLLVTVSVVTSEVSPPGLWEQFRTGFLIRPILYLFLIILLSDSRSIHRALLAFVFAHGILMLTCLSDWVQKGGGLYRVQGSLSAINYLSYVCIATLPILVGLTLYLRHTLLRFGVGALALVTLFISLQTLSRSGFFALAGTLFFLAWRLISSPRTFITAVGFTLLFVILIPTGLSDRLAEVESLQDTSRYHLSRVGYRMALDNPLIGVGWQAYEAKFLDYDQEGRFTKPKAPHSLYFSIAAQSGFPALAIYLAMYAITLFQTFQLQETYRARGHTLHLGYFLAVGIEAALVGHFIFGLAGSYGDTYYAYFLLALGVVLVRYHRTHTEPPPLR